MRRSGSTRKESAPGGRTRQNIVLAAAPERSKPLIGMTHQSIVTQVKSDLIWSSSASLKSVGGDFQPLAAVAGLWDQYKLTNIRIRLFQTGLASSGVPFAVCWDPTNAGGVGAPTTVSDVLSYQNSDIVQMTIDRPNSDHTIANPTHLLYAASTESTPSTNPMRTDSYWNAGLFYIVPFTTTTATLSCVIEFTVEYSKPRGER